MQLQLSNQQTENRFTHLMNARSANLQEEAQGGQALPTMNAVTGYRHQTDLERSGLPNGALENPMSGWAQGHLMWVDLIIKNTSSLCGCGYYISMCSID